MELRDIEIFLTLAEELHFGRAAERLHVSQARVSQAIAGQERRLGGALFDRSNRRRIRLTPLGQQLRDDLRPVYTGLRDSLERARLTARGVTGTLRVGLLPFNVAELHPYWKAFRAQNPQWELRVRPLPYVDPFAALRRGETDVLVVWLPVEEPDLTVGPVLFTDPRLLAVFAENELASRASVSLETLADHPHASAPLRLDYWEDRYLPFHTPRGRAIERTHWVTTSDELINLVGNGDVVHTFPSHVTRYWLMPHIRWLPVHDMPPLSYALVWRADSETDLIRALAHTVRNLGPVHFDDV
ncbi:LysR family transcriptional regulator [Actinokineospora sp. UTMC 2448]|uniref:LysR family transcriptional regulator n=1 Tax=Actinokineospora sp. UTMC 2448 TaxID=2268449 RepID=UPI0021648E68|nr:LysR family transcriptional regulator [Actinokineospora sp. UTMC 2448]UVS78456.1 Morphology and auto-aggregation control protein [Actinokineospora sp. UTMC 2448]